MYVRYKQFTTYTNTCLIFWETEDKKVLEGCGNPPKVTPVRAETSILVYTKPPGEIALTVSLEDLLVLPHVAKKQGRGETVSFVKNLYRNRALAARVTARSCGHRADSAGRRPGPKTAGPRPRLPAGKPHLGKSRHEGETLGVGLGWWKKDQRKKRPSANRASSKGGKNEHVK